MRPYRLSIRTRLTLAYAAVSAITGGVLLSVVHLLARRSLFFADADLVSTVGAIAATPAVAPSATRVSGLPASPDAAGQIEVAWAPHVYEAIDRAREEALRSILLQSGIVFAISVFVALLLCWLVASRALRPLRTITEVADRLSHDTLEERITASGPRDELSTLADTFNTMLDRLGAAFQAQQLFAANASHELRTPLTIIQAAAERALSRPHRAEDEYRAALTTVVAAAHRSERLLSSLLTLARLRQPPAPGRLDLAETAAECVRTIRSPTIHAELAPAATTADPVLIDLLVRNLVENAVRHNVPGGAVWLCTRTDAGTAVLEVANTGPVVPADTIPTLRQAFQRGGRHTRGAEGSGLGLAIVDAIVTAHDGAWSAIPRDGGGLLVTLRLPAAPPRAVTTAVPPHASST
ncbi:signal transduction histidine kinase [Catenuloplanes nepalensis]|uniref:histidine kinase n=1 Tax=Catenuloplanes nepalensis TaxID=587533 RepID=A0ABT9MQ38_9ACTN|nr:ATP-binding protein [Catenuloplanes nepalensis]MDP9793530.1 signal transduction histidine kinase [Catenuloplanes nepalensis]